MGAERRSQPIAAALRVEETKDLFSQQALPIKAKDHIIF